MFLAVDIGNTSINIGVYKGDELVANWKVATHIHKMPDEYGVLLLELIKSAKVDAEDIKKITVCSVVPPLTAVFTELFKKYFHVKPLVVGAGVKTGVKIRMDNPKEVGADRVVNAAAAHHLYSGPVIVVDLGTATNFDTVSGSGEYIGGAIAPGMDMAAEALFERTAKLPRIELEKPKQAIGKNTINAMQSGIVFGYIGLVEAIIERIKKELDGEVKVVATGGYAELIAKNTEAIDEVNSELTLIGLRLISLLNE